MVSTNGGTLEPITCVWLRETRQTGFKIASPSLLLSKNPNLKSSLNYGNKYLDVSAVYH
jgi:hypothetical protein